MVFVRNLCVDHVVPRGDTEPHLFVQDQNGTQPTTGVHSVPYRKIMFLVVPQLEILFAELPQPVPVTSEERLVHLDPVVNTSTRTLEPRILRLIVERYRTNTVSFSIVSTSTGLNPLHTRGIFTTTDKSSVTSSRDVSTDNRGLRDLLL